MAVPVLDSVGLIGRVVGVTALVFLLPPFGALPMLISPEESHAPTTAVFIAIILLACAHVYLFTRAYYSLKSVGILVMTIIYLLVAYSLMSSFGLGVSANNARWYAAAYLSMLYSYGLCYNFVDSFLSGLLHTKSV